MGWRSRYRIGIGRDGFGWAGTEFVTHKAEWPIGPRRRRRSRVSLACRDGWQAGDGPPLGASAFYVGDTVYRIHGTDMPETIGHKVSSGCLLMLNADVIDLYTRLDVGTKIIVLRAQGSLAAAEDRELQTAHTRTMMPLRCALGWMLAIASGTFR